MSSQPTRFKADLRKSFVLKPVVDRITEQQQLRKKKRGESFTKQRDVTKGDLEDLIEDVEMLDVSKTKLDIRNHWIDLLGSNRFSDNLMAVERASRFIRWHNEQGLIFMVDSGVIRRMFELLCNAQALSTPESFLVSLFKVSCVHSITSVSLISITSF